jgi:putative membrane protein
VESVLRPSPSSGSSGPPPTESKVRSPYRSQSRSSRFNRRTPSWRLSFLGTLGLSALLALVVFGPSFSGGPWSSSGTTGALIAWAVFAIPLVGGGLLSIPLSLSVGGALYLRRTMYLSLLSGALWLGLAFLWRGFSLWLGPLPVAPLWFVSWGMVLWLRHMVVMGVSTPSHWRALPASLTVSLVGDAIGWAALGHGVPEVVGGLFALLAGFLGMIALLRAVNRPMEREFGEGGLALVRPLMEHMNDRDPGAQSRVESFFDRLSTYQDLYIQAIRFADGPSPGVVWIVPSVHPGPFGQLGSSDLPRKISEGLSQGGEAVVVPHSPSNHDQDIPTSGEVNRLIGEIRDLLSRLREGPLRASPLVSPRPGSLARAQVIGNAAIVVITQAPDPTDDIDYAVAEYIREEARRLGLQDVAVVDAHNSYVENRGGVPFGSPTAFQLFDDAVQALRKALQEAPSGPVRVGFAQIRGYTPREDGIGPEGISATVVEAAGRRTAYVLFDANNLLQGFREPLLRILREWADDGEIMTTDNHIVHEVAGGLNPLGRRRPLDLLCHDLRELLPQAVSDLHPVRIYAGGTRLNRVRVLGPGVTQRLMVALGDSFSAFWSTLPLTFLVAVLSSTLLFMVLR